MKTIEKVLLEDSEYNQYTDRCKKLGRSRRAQTTQLIKEFLEKE